MRSILALTIALVTALLLFSCSGEDGTGPVPSELAGRITIDSVSALNGDEIKLAVRLQLTEDGIKIDSLRQYLFQIAYNHSVLTFLSAEQGDADSSWNYFNWRVSGVTALRREIYVSAARVPSVQRPLTPGQKLPVGVLFWLNFAVTSDTSLIGFETEVNFSTETCTENALVDGTDNSLLHIARYQRMNDSVIPTLDTMWCPRHYKLSPDLEFVAGAIEITAPPYVPPDPAISVSVSPVTGHLGDTVQAEIKFNYGVTPPYDPPDFGGFDLLLEYDSTAIQPIEVLKGPQLSGWEYFTWRHVPSTHMSGPGHGGIRMVSILEMNNGVPATGPFSPTGSVAGLRLVLLRDITPAEGCSTLVFYSEDAGDNLISDRSGDIVFMPLVNQRSMRFGSDYMSEVCVIDSCVRIIQFRQEGCDIP